MGKFFRTFVSVAVLVIAAWAGAAAEMSSNASIVLTDPSGSILWKTVSELLLPVSVDWPKGAVSARLMATVGTTSLLDVTLTDTSVRTYAVDLALPQTEGAEAILDLSLVFKDSSGAVLDNGTSTARLGLVRGCCGNAFRCIPQGAASGKWKVVDKSAVAFVPGDTASLTLDGDALDFGTAPGWAYLTGLAVGGHVLAKTDASENVVTAPLRVSGGLTLLIR